MSKFQALKVSCLNCGRQLVLVDLHSPTREEKKHRGHCSKCKIDWTIVVGTQWMGDTLIAVVTYKPVAFQKQVKKNRRRKQ